VRKILPNLETANNFFFKMRYLRYSITCLGHVA